MFCKEASIYLQNPILKAAQRTLELERGRENSVFMYILMKAFNRTIYLQIF